MIDLIAIKERQQAARRLLARKQGRAVSDATFAVALIDLGRDVSDLIAEMEAVTVQRDALSTACKAAELFAWRLYCESGKMPDDPAKQVWLDLKHTTAQIEKGQS